jgi:phytoene/squalene synthetase
VDDAIEAELIAAHLATFGRDRAAWIDVYATVRSADESVDVASALAAAEAAWERHRWAHPAVVARLEELLGPLDGD